MLKPGAFLSIFSYLPAVPQPSTADIRTRLWKEYLSSMYRVDYIVYDSVQIGVLLTEPVDFVDGVEDGGVMFPAEHAPDLRQRGWGKLLDQIHCDLTGVGDIAGVGLLFKLRRLHLEAVG